MSEAATPKTASGKKGWPIGPCEGCGVVRPLRRGRCSSCRQPAAKSRGLGGPAIAEKWRLLRDAKVVLADAALAWWRERTGDNYVRMAAAAEALSGLYVRMDKRGEE